MSKFVADIAGFITCLWGVVSLKDSQFKPLGFFFYFAGIIITAMVMGYLAEAGYDKLKNRKKKNEMGMGKRHF